MTKEKSSSHILIVDDDAILRSVSSEALTQAGFSVEEAENGKEAIAAIERRRPDIVLLDVMMPEMDGYETCLVIRGMPYGDTLPVVMITALEDLDSIVRAYEVGATDFITKPVNWVILVQRVRYMLRAVRQNTERIHLQEELQQAQRLKAIGTLSSGIAHDFKNLLQIIQGSVELLMLNKKPDDPDLPDLQEIFTTTQIGHDLVQQMLTYSRSLKSEKRKTDLNAQISLAEKRLRKSIPNSISIQLKLDEDLPAISLDPVQLEQILTNLAVNARDAMPEGGTLGIKTFSVELTRAYCKRHPTATPGMYACLSVSDSGEGMDEATVSRIFEPFFSTKEVGKGTGLGLSMVYGIIENHEGHITCASVPGKGTTFRIFLPLETDATIPEQWRKDRSRESSKPLSLDDEPKETAPPEKAAANPPGSRETILLVDDEHLIQKFGKRRLEFEGYRVITASSGEDALDLYRKEKDRIDLILMDLVMPGMGGETCMQEILQIDPGAKIVLASAFSDGEDRMEELKGKASGLLRKPYLSEDLLQAVYDALQGGGGE